MRKFHFRPFLSFCLGASQLQLHTLKLTKYTHMHTKAFSQCRIKCSQGNFGHSNRNTSTISGCNPIKVRTNATCRSWSCVQTNIVSVMYEIIALCCFNFSVVCLVSVCVCVFSVVFWLPENVRPNDFKLKQHLRDS